MWGVGVRYFSVSNDQRPIDDGDEIISRLYDVALDPARYEALLDQWEHSVGPLRHDGGRLKHGLIDDQTIADHFRRASHFLDQLPPPGETDERSALIAQFDKTAALIISDKLVIERLNESAARALEAEQDQSVSALPIEDVDLEALTRKLRDMLRSAPVDPSVFRVRSNTSGRFIILHLRHCQLSDGTPQIVALTSEVSWPDNFSSILQAAFEFTKAEVEVVRMLIECCSLKEIAEQRGRAVDTVRAQLKSILSKTETNSQIELVRLTLSMMDIASHALDAEPAAHLNSSVSGTLKPVPFQSISTDDGRRIDYIILGDPKGSPCVFLPIDYGLIRWPASAEAAALETGIKVVVPVRAGYGASDPLPKQMPFCEGATNDLRAVLTHEKIDACPFISMGSDSYFAFHYAMTHPDQVKAIIACSGTLPLTRADQYERMEKWHRFIIAGARYTPNLLPFMVKAGFSLARRIGKRGFVNSGYGNNPADIETFENPETYEAMITGSEVALSDTHSAHASFARQVVEQETIDWSYMVEAVKASGIPVTFLNGLQDPQVPPLTLAEFQQEQTWINFEIFADAGQLLFFRKWPLVLEKLRQYL
jgi:pimeloyl-ACP methyl ester carboxylesterase/DNA-binding CsgD family transcriptional regulator